MESLEGILKGIERNRRNLLKLGRWFDYGSIHALLLNEDLIFFRKLPLYAAMVKAGVNYIIT